MNYERIIDNIVELASHKLSDWETGFIDSVSSQDYDLTEDQQAKILEIQNRHLKY